MSHSSVVHVVVPFICPDRVRGSFNIRKLVPQIRASGELEAPLQAWQQTLGQEPAKQKQTVYLLVKNCANISRQYHTVSNCRYALTDVQAMQIVPKCLHDRHPLMLRRLTASDSKPIWRELLFLPVSVVVCDISQVTLFFASRVFPCVSLAEGVPCTEFLEDHL